ncbi:hypothetical protein ACRC6Q_09610 [Planococcus sp. SE5232]|uniref:hypothetical protein n=1 Tax=unclassified Planococcus (in: firmicutes) TaxID=2662419 RepID=UPI001CC14CDA|nr:hypothetical protein [Planococcus sp. 4-30]
MKRFMILFLSTILLCSCNPFDSSDYQGYIEEVKKSSIIISPPATDPEADYPIYEVFSTEETIVEGKKESFDELERLDKVEVWVDKKSEEKELAETIVVED